MTKKVISFTMHENAFISAFGRELKKTVTSKLHPGLEMELTPGGIYCQMEQKGRRHHFLVPLVNCKIVELEPESVGGKEKGKGEKEDGAAQANR